MFIYVLVVVLVVIGLLVGWLGPKAFKSRRPYGLAADLAVGAIITPLFGLAEWYWIGPAFGFHGGWLLLSGVLTEPAILSGIVLWLMRR